MVFLIRNKDIAGIEKKLYSLPRDKVHKLLLLHLSGFSDFFLNIASYGDEVEKTLGARVGAKTLAPLSQDKLNDLLRKDLTHKTKFSHDNFRKESKKIMIKIRIILMTYEENFEES